MWIMVILVASFYAPFILFPNADYRVKVLTAVIIAPLVAAAACATSGETKRARRKL